MTNSYNINSFCSLRDPTFWRASGLSVAESVADPVHAQKSRHLPHALILFHLTEAAGSSGESFGPWAMAHLNPIQVRGHKQRTPQPPGKVLFITFLKEDPRRVRRTSPPSLGLLYLRQWQATSKASIKRLQQKNELSECFGHGS